MAATASASPHLTLSLSPNMPPAACSLLFRAALPMLRQHTRGLPRCGQGKGRSLCDGIRPQGSSRKRRVAVSLRTRHGVLTLWPRVPSCTHPVELDPSCTHPGDLGTALTAFHASVIFLCTSQVLINQWKGLKACKHAASPFSPGANVGVYLLPPPVLTSATAHQLQS